MSGNIGGWLTRSMQGCLQRRDPHSGSRTDMFDGRNDYKMLAAGRKRLAGECNFRDMVNGGAQQKACRLRKTERKDSETWSRGSVYTFLDMECGD